MPLIVVGSSLHCRLRSFLHCRVRLDPLRMAEKLRKLRLPGIRCVAHCLSVFWYLH